MRLLDVQDFEIQSGFSDNPLIGAEDGMWHLSPTQHHVPRYAILSHRWIGEEITFQDFGKLDKDRLRKVPPRNPLCLHDGDIRPPTEGKPGDVSGNLASLHKIAGACMQVRHTADSGDTNPIRHIWIDTVCINRADANELSTAINSMFSWYEHAAVCYVYLYDVEWDGSATSRQQFRDSEWFRRGWTLQELLAPLQVEFFDRNWNHIGSKTDLVADITLATNISEEFLLVPAAFHAASLGQKMSWLSLRDTQRIEDRAYCMLGIFKVYMDTRYGQGPSEFLRLQEAILRRWDRNTPFDETLFAWESDKIESSGLLAPSPLCFRHASNVIFDPSLALLRWSDRDSEERGLTERGPGGIELNAAYQVTIKVPWSLTIYPLITLPLTCGLIFMVVMGIAIAKSKTGRYRIRLNAWVRGDDGRLRSIELAVEKTLDGPLDIVRRVDCHTLYESSMTTLYRVDASQMVMHGSFRIPHKVTYHSLDLPQLQSRHVGAGKDAGT